MEPRIHYTMTSDGVNIAYATAGSGPPLVWFMSPMQSHVQLEWDQPVIRAGHEAVVSGGAMLVRFDPRGTGLSDRNVADVSSSAMARDLQAVVGQLQLDQFPLVAIESGAGASIIYATLHPEKVSRLVLINPASGEASMTDRGKKWLALDWEMLTETVASMAFGFGYEESRKYAAFQRAAIEQETFRRFVSESLDLPHLAKQLRVPTLVIRHTGVTWLSMESTRSLVAAIPDCRMVAIEGIYTDHPGQTSRAIAEFLAPDLPGTSSSSPEPSPAVVQRPEPSSLRTILFTDLVGHAEMMSRLGDERGRAVLREHEDITRGVLKQHGGTEVKTMGDGFMASFGSVTKAVECAVALQRAFATARASRCPCASASTPASRSKKTATFSVRP